MGNYFERLKLTDGKNNYYFYLENNNTNEINFICYDNYISYMEKENNSYKTGELDKNWTFFKSSNNNTTLELKKGFIFDFCETPVSYYNPDSYTDLLMKDAFIIGEDLIRYSAENNRYEIDISNKEQVSFRNNGQENFNFIFPNSAVQCDTLEVIENIPLGENGRVSSDIIEIKNKAQVRKIE